MDPGNGVFSYRHGMSVGQIFVSSFFLYIAGLFKRSNRSGWSTKSTFSLFRIVGGSCLLALINDRSDVLWVVAFVCEWKGVLLVLFLLVEVLQDMNGQIQGLHPWEFYSPTVIAAAESAVSIAGFVEMSNQNNLLRPTRYSIAAAALVALNHLCVLGIGAALRRRREQISKTYKPGLSCIFACALPLMMRIVYLLVYMITGDKMWNSMKGNATLYLCLSAFPEIAAVSVCSWTILRRPPKEEKHVKSADLEEAKSQQYLPLGQGSNGKSVTIAAAVV